MPKVVISGATSFLGKRLVKKAVGAGWDVVAVVRKGTSQDIFPAGVTVCYLSMEEYAVLGNVVGDCDCFVHLAWNGTRGAARMNQELQRENRNHSIAAVRSVLETGCQCVISAGSQAEYGPHNTQISEDTPCSPNTAYGIEKLQFYYEMEALCQSAHVSYREPRIFSLYGPKDNAETMIMTTLGNMLRNEPCKLTQGLQMWDFMYIDDAVEALVHLCAGEGEDGVYNFGSGDVRPLRNYILELAQITATKSELCFGAVPYPPTGIVSIWPNIAKLKQQLRTQKMTSFAEGVQETIASMIVRNEL